MGALYSMLGAAGNGVTDPILGMTDKEKKAVQASMAKLMTNSTESGKIIMHSFFKNYPTHLKLFPFKNVEIDNLPRDIKFKVHCNTVMYSLSQIINNLDDPELVLGMLDKLSAAHIRHNTPAKGFQDIKVVILAILEEMFPKATCEAWEKLLDVSMKHISDKLPIKT